MVSWENKYKKKRWLWQNEKNHKRFSLSWRLQTQYRIRQNDAGYFLQPWMSTWYTPISSLVQEEPEKGHRYGGELLIKQLMEPAQSSGQPQILKTSPTEVLSDISFIFQLTHPEPGLFLLSPAAAKTAVQAPNYPCLSKSAGISKLQNSWSRLVSYCKDFNTCTQVTPQNSPKRWIWQDTEVPSTHRKPAPNRCCQPWKPNCLPPGPTPSWKCPAQKSWVLDRAFLSTQITKISANLMFRYAYPPLHDTQKPCQDPSPNCGLQTQQGCDSPRSATPGVLMLKSCLKQVAPAHYWQLPLQRVCLAPLLANENPRREYLYEKREVQRNI